MSYHEKIGKHANIDYDIQQYKDYIHGRTAQTLIKLAKFHAGTHSKFNMKIYNITNIITKRRCILLI